MRQIRDSKQDYSQDSGRDESGVIREIHYEHRRFGHRINGRHRDDRRSTDGFHDDRRRRDRNHDFRNDSRLSESPPLLPKVTILRPASSASQKSLNPINQNNHQPATNSNSTVSKAPGAIQIIQSNHQNSGPTSSSQQHQASQNANSTPSLIQNVEEIMTDMIENMPSVMKLIDPESWSFFEHTASEFLFSDNISPNANSFTVISAVGGQSVGKSSLLNKIAGRNVFKTHNDTDNPTSYLKHLTRGIDLHVTKERLLLLDCQPVMTASVLDEVIIKNSSIPANLFCDAPEPEIYVYITSLQLLSFLIAVCDYVIIVNDWLLDVNMLKLLATAMMMVGTEAHHAEIIFYFPQLKEEDRKKISQTIRTLFGGDFSYNVIKDIIDETITAPKLLKLLSRREISSDDRSAFYLSEKNWLVSSQRFWENSVRKSSLFSDYARLML